MVHLSAKALLFSAVLLVLSLDGIHAADEPQCRTIDNPCGGSNAPCCDGLKCIGYSYSGIADGICRPPSDDKPKCRAVDNPCGGSRAPCCDGLECLGYSYMDMPDGVCRPKKPVDEAPAPSDPPKDAPPKGDGGKENCLLGIDLGLVCL